MGGGVYSKCTTPHQPLLSAQPSSFNLANVISQLDRWRYGISVLPSTTCNMRFQNTEEWCGWHTEFMPLDIPSATPMKPHANSQKMLAHR